MPTRYGDGRSRVRAGPALAIKYDLAIDLKDGRYRYNLTHLEFVVDGTTNLGKLGCEDKKKDLETINVI